ncbi:MAG TPA: histidinol dehydrogenase [Candidatus Mcinerneyibacteriales bacterium]|nr:histidinol dehydrogenase [Candidatus Mcinerneyibacteriales bacterium]
MIKKMNVTEFLQKRKADRQESIRRDVEEIIKGVIRGGDEALRDYSLKFDLTEIHDFRVAREVMEKVPSLPEKLKRSLLESYARLEDFARFQLGEARPFSFREKETAPGLRAGERIVPVRRAGVYVPGGRFPLFSSLLMGVAPARVAGVKEIALFTPPGKDGKPHPVILAAAALLGIEEVYALGGAQAIAAMAYGTESIPKVDIIAGPGNSWVTEAKRQVFGDVGIDLVAGPSEILVIADDSCDPALVAADLYAQAEHDTHAMPLLAVFGEEARERILKEVQVLLDTIPDAETARISFTEKSACFLVSTFEEAATLADSLAPEHLQLHVEEPGRYLDVLSNYGSLFAGAKSAEVLGDYVSGLNHTLPTGGTARFQNGLNVWTFLKRQTVLQADERCDSRIYAAAQIMAEAEGLKGHARSADSRLKKRD